MWPPSLGAACAASISFSRAVTLAFRLSLSFLRASDRYNTQVHCPVKPFNAQRNPPSQYEKLRILLYSVAYCSICM